MKLERVEITEVPNSYSKYLVVTNTHSFMFRTLKGTLDFIAEYFSYKKGD